MTFNAKNEDPAIINHDDGLKSLESARMIAIDTIRIDEHSRLTFTKKVKKVFPMLPQDTLVVYQDKYNSDELLFKVQRDGSIVDGWLVKRRRVAIANYKSSSLKDTNNRLLTISSNKIFQTTSDTSSEFGKKVPSVLIVDDEEDVLYAFEVILSSQKYHVKAFSGSKEALKHIVEQNNYSQYALAIIDIRLPDINGIQLYQILKIINKKIKVLFVSALDAAEELTSLFPEIRTGDIIRKPVSQQDFIEKVDEILTSSTPDNSS